MRQEAGNFIRTFVPVSDAKFAGELQKLRVQLDVRVLFRTLHLRQESFPNDVFSLRQLGVLASVVDQRDCPFSDNSRSNNR